MSNITKLSTAFITLLIIWGNLSTTAFSTSLSETHILNTPTTLYVGGTGPGNYTTIQEAINNASTGDTIFVYNHSSPYYETLTINKTINLIGEEKNSTVIDGSSQPQSIISLTADNTTITGFTLQNTIDHPNAGVYLHAHNTNIYNNKITNNIVGMYLEWAVNCTVTHNEIINNRWHGIQLISSSYNTISFNQIINNPERGLTCDFSRCNNLHNNTIIDSEIGISLEYYSEYNKVQNNTASSNRNEGILIRASNNIVKDNYVSNNKYGILFTSGDNVTFTQNVMEKNFCGMVIIFSSNTMSRHNTFTKNFLGFDITNSNDVQIKQNNFFQNIFSGFFKDYDYNEEKMTFAENFWNRPHIFPYPILGRIGFLRFILQFDDDPSDHPY